MQKIEQNIYLLKNNIQTLISDLFFNQLIRRFINPPKPPTLIGVTNMGSFMPNEKSPKPGSESVEAPQEGKYLKTENPLDGRQLQNILPDVSTLLTTENDHGK